MVLQPAKLSKLYLCSCISIHLYIEVKDIVKKKKLNPDNFSFIILSCLAVSLDFPPFCTPFYTSDYCNLFVCVCVCTYVHLQVCAYCMLGVHNGVMKQSKARLIIPGIHTYINTQRHTYAHKYIIFQPCTIYIQCDSMNCFVVYGGISGGDVPRL